MEPIVGIVAEYNPFHNGHLYQLREAKRRSGADCAVAVMSGNFVQRGAPAAADKWERAASAAACGADLVLELPFFYACNSAELFAEGGIGILRGLGCVTHLSFGCETQCPELLKAAADVLAEEPAAFRQQLRVFLDRGESYPKARWEALRAVCGQKTASVIESPNNILAVEYLKQCIRQGWNPEYVPVFRKGASYDEKQLSGETASAAALRESYDGFCAEDPDKRDAGAWKKTIERFLPEISLDMLLQKGASKQKLEEGLYPVLISKILTAAPEELGELVSAGEEIRGKMGEYYTAFTDYLAEKGSDRDSLLGRFFLSIDGDALIDRLFDRLDLTFEDLVELALTTFSWLSTLVTSLFFALYALAGKEKLIAPIKRLTYALLPQRTADRLGEIAEMTRASFVRFFSGQCIEAMVLGVLIYIAFRLFGIPYAMVVATLTAFCALIPYVGAFLSCAVGVLLSLLESPQTALLCLVVYLSIQFIESELIYPHVVGASVGLSPLWTLIAALVGESLFGIVGMVLFIPLVAVLYALVSDALRRRLDQKGLSAVYTGEESPLRAPEKQKRRLKKHPPAKS